MKEERKTIAIIGGVAGGASAAAKARRTDAFARIVLFEKGEHVSFANCGLPFHISKEIAHRDDLFVVTPERLEERYRIEVRLRSEVTRIDRDMNALEVTDLDRGHIYRETYDKLIIATGASPIRPEIPGIDAEGVFMLRTIADMDGILAFCDGRSPATAAVIGGGFIGLEAAEALHQRGLEVSIVEAADQLLLPWDPEMADMVEQHLLNELWIEVYKGEKATRISSDQGRATGIVLEGGATVDAELVIVAAGLVPETRLAREAGLQINKEGLIVTDERMQTMDPDIFAVGDAISTLHRVTKRKVWLPMAGPANRQGRVAGTNAAGGDASFKGVVGTAIVRVGKVVAGRTGLNEREATAAGIDCFTSLSSSLSRAGYYPGAQDIVIKLVAERTGRLLGAQVVGRDGVDKRTDVLATAVTAKMSVCDLVDLELAYAPPFGAAKDPINIAGMVAQNTLDGVTAATTWDAVLAEDPAPLVIDVRSPEERKTVYVTQSEHIYIDALRDRLGDMDKGAPIRLYCRVGQRGYLAEQLLRAEGFTDVKNISGGWRAIWGELREEHLVGQEPEE